MKTRLEKFTVCNECYCVGILFTDCQCSHGKYETIELEYEVCDCCGNLIEDGNYAETEFNKNQLKR